jgi:hypothetical protein
MVANPWLFPGYHPGTHLDPQSIMLRLRKLGVDLLGGRNSALQNLVAEVPPPLVAELLGYSCGERRPRGAASGGGARGLPAVVVLRRRGQGWWRCGR